VLNVAPHVEYIGNAVYEYLPGLLRGTGEPQPTARSSSLTVDLVPRSRKGVRSALSAGAISPGVRHSGTGCGSVEPPALCPPPSAAQPVGGLEGRNEQALPDGVSRFIARTTVEILTLRPTLSLGLGSPPRE